MRVGFSVLLGLLRSTNEVRMRRVFLGALAVCLLARHGLGDTPESDTAHRVVLGVNEYLSAGADAIRAGQYDDGIRLTLMGLDRGVDGQRNRAAGLANLCAAHVAKKEPDKALPYCNESLSLNDGNWRAYSNRSHAHLLQGSYEQAANDNQAAAALNPNAAHVRMIREMLNERLLQPSVTIEEHH
jgi:tetratricopeptide (TPR) repeat protein